MQSKCGNWFDQRGRGGGSMTKDIGEHSRAVLCIERTLRRRQVVSYRKVPLMQSGTLGIDRRGSQLLPRRRGRTVTMRTHSIN